MDKDFDEIVAEYEPLLLSSVSSFSDSTDLSADDLYQTALVALHRAYVTFREDCGVTFGLYAKICIRNACISEMRKRSSSKRRAQALPPSSGIENGTESPVYLSGLDLSGLSCFEKKVLTLRAEGLSYSEIAVRLGKNTKSVDNALRRAKDKLRRSYGPNRKET